VPHAGKILKTMAGHPLDDDVKTVRKVLRGDANAFSGLVGRYQRPIFNFVYRFFNSYDLAGELTQDTFLKAFQSLRSFDQERKFSTWLYTIARNVCIDEYKRRKHAGLTYLEDLPHATEGIPSGDPGASPQFQCIMREEGARLMAAIQELEPDKKAALLLHYFQGLSYLEIAEALEIPLSTVKIRIFRAKKALLKSLGGKGSDDEAARNLLNSEA
jgi:RNA polymerase sigma-70 factor (ECF subfamily)